jgi:signal transduction histidine kinase
VTVEVEDNGSGVAPESIHRVFDSFFTTKPPGSGTGLGLNISYAVVVHKHRGDITVASEPGKTIFRVELPRVVPA